MTKIEGLQQTRYDILSTRDEVVGVGLEMLIDNEDSDTLIDILSKLEENLSRCLELVNTAIDIEKSISK